MKAAPNGNTCSKKIFMSCCYCINIVISCILCEPPVAVLRCVNIVSIAASKIKSIRFYGGTAHSDCSIRVNCRAFDGAKIAKICNSVQGTICIGRLYFYAIYVCCGHFHITSICSLYFCALIAYRVPSLVTCFLGQLAHQQSYFVCRSQCKITCLLLICYGYFSLRAKYCSGFR